MNLRNWWLDHAPWPLWTIATCKPFSPWCLVDDVAHWLFPMTFGFSSENVSHYPGDYPLICRVHDRAGEKWMRKHHPEYFDGE